MTSNLRAAASFPVAYDRFLKFLTQSGLRSLGPDCASKLSCNQLRRPVRRYGLNECTNDVRRRHHVSGKQHVLAFPPGWRKLRFESTEPFEIVKNGKASCGYTHHLC